MPVSDQLRSLVKHKNSLHTQIKRGNTSLLDQYRNVKAKYKSLHRTEQRLWYANKMKVLNELHHQNKSREYWQLLKQWAGWSKPIHAVNEQQVIDSSGAVLFGFNNVVQHWTAAFQSAQVDCSQFHKHQLLAGSRLVDRYSFQEDLINELNTVITADEVRLIVSASPLNKASGLDNIPAEAYKFGGEPMISALTELFNQVLESEQLPVSWNHALIKPLFKAGDDRSPSNWRPISLIPTVAKLFSSIIALRLQQHCDRHKVLSDQQYAFRAGRSIDEPLFIFNELLQYQCVELNKQVFVCAIDLSKAFDTVWRDGLMMRLFNVGVRGKMLRLIRNMYTHTTASVWLNNKRTQEFELKTGVRQGENSSPLLFNIFIDQLSQHIKQHFATTKQITIKGVHLTHLIYADDLLLFANGHERLQELMQIAAVCFNQLRLSVNVNKTKVIVFSRQQSLNRSQFTFSVNSQPIEVVPQMKYLGVLFNQDLSFTAHQQDRVNAANNRVLQLSWMSRRGMLMSVKSQIEAYELVVQPLLLFAAHLCKYGRSVWRQAESVQHKAACKMLNSFRTTNVAALQGELGWLTVKQRCDLKHLLYLSKLHQFDSDTQIGQIVSQRMKQPETGSWFHHTHQLVRHYSLTEQFDQMLLGETAEWKRAVKKQVLSVSQHEWLLKVQQSSRLQTYTSLHTELRRAAYINHKERTTQEARGRVQMTRLRVGCNSLAVDEGRKTRLSVQLRVCFNCLSNTVEDERHVLLHCSAFACWRDVLFDVVSRLTESRIDLSLFENETVFQFMLGCLPEQLNDCLKKTSANKPSLMKKKDLLIMLGCLPDQLQACLSKNSSKKEVTRAKGLLLRAVKLFVYQVMRSHRHLLKERRKKQVQVLIKFDCPTARLQLHIQPVHHSSVE